MKKVLSILLILLIIPFAATFADIIKIGWLPYTDAMKILKIHSPLRDYLSNKLNADVEISTSQDYVAFYEDTQKGVFDIIVTGPHFGAMHIKNGFIPLFKYKTHLKPIFVVKKDSNIKDVKQLKGKQIALSNYLSVSSMGGLKWMKDEGLSEGNDFKVFNASSHTSAIQSVIIGESAAAITTNTPLKQLAANLQNEIKYFESPFSLPHLFTIASPKLDKKKVEAIRSALKEFSDKSEEGKVYFKDTGYEGYTDITKDDLKQFDSFIFLTKKYIEEYKKKK